MVDILGTIGSSLRDLALWLDISTTTLVILLFAAFLLVLLFAAIVIKKKISRPTPTPTETPTPEIPASSEEEGTAPEAAYTEKTLLDFPAGKVQIDANVSRLTIKLMETEPKVVEKIVEVEKEVEKIVEVPQEKKPPEVKPIDIGQASDLNNTVQLLGEKYSLDSFTLTDESGKVKVSSSKTPEEDATAALGLAAKGGEGFTRIEIKGEKAGYVFPVLHEKKTFLAMVKAEEKEGELLDILATDIGNLKKFL